MTDRYNGWTNYETWNACLWFESDYWQEEAEAIMREANNDREEATSELAQRMEDDADENMPAVSGMYADLLGSAMSCINWYEIAKHYVDDVEVEEVDDVEE